VEQEGEGFSHLIEEYHRRFQLPIIVTETSARGGEDVRARWLEASVSAIRELRAHGVPVLGYTWFPLFTMVDWRYRFGRGPIEEYYLELGLYTLRRDGAGGNGDDVGGRWNATPLVEQYRSYTGDAESAIGPLLTDAGLH